MVFRKLFRAIVMSKQNRKKITKEKQTKAKDSFRDASIHRKKHEISMDSLQKKTNVPSIRTIQSSPILIQSERLSPL